MAETSKSLDATKLGPLAAEWLRAPTYFLIHAVVGTFIFTLIACTAFGLHALVHFFDKEELGDLFVWGLRIAEYALFLADLSLFIVFLWRAFIRTLREL
jgi:hypothetical protein